MKSYFIIGALKGGARRDGIIAVGDSFSWLAAIFAPLWFLWRGMALHAFASGLVYAILLSLIVAYPEHGFLYAIAALIALWVGYEARYFYLEFLKNPATDIIDVVLAPSAQCAEEIYLNKNGAFAIETSHAPEMTSKTAHPNSDNAPNLIFSQNWET